MTIKHYVWTVKTLWHQKNLKFIFQKIRTNSLVFIFLFYKYFDNYIIVILIFRLVIISASERLYFDL